MLISSEETLATFEQHKKLKSRADEYLLKPLEESVFVAKVGGPASGWAATTRTTRSTSWTPIPTSCWPKTRTSIVSSADDDEEPTASMSSDNERAGRHVRRRS